MSATGSPGKSSRSTRGTGQILNELSRRNAAASAGSKRRGRSMAGLLGIMIMLPLLAGVLFLAWQQFLLQAAVTGLQQENRRLATELASQSDTLAELRQADSEFNAELESLQQAEIATTTDPELARLFTDLLQELGTLQETLEVSEE